MGISRVTMEMLLDKHHGNNALAAQEANISESQWYQYKRIYHLKNKRPEKLTPQESVAQDSQNDQIEDKKKEIQKKYDIVRQENEALKQLLEASRVIGTANTYTIKPRKYSRGGATAVGLMSDSHYEEVVESQNVNGKNEYNPEIAQQRLEMFFISLVKLVQIFSKESNIETLILALLGDFINGQLREEAMENNALRPMDALLAVSRVLSAGITYILDNTELDLVIPCHSGNHSRTTKKVHPSTEAGNSLEYVLYNGLAKEFKDNKRVKFLIPRSLHSYLDVNGYIIRFHHGHSMNYKGGVGGIYISVNKAIAQWNKVQRADLDVFGHFHQFRDGGNFICNGSIIGWNEFANFIKADFEKPKQAFFLIDHERKEKTVTAPIFLYK